MNPEAAAGSIIDQLRRLAQHLELAVREVETLRKDLERLSVVHDEQGHLSFTGRQSATHNGPS